jgi:hypothetical protein
MIARGVKIAITMRLEIGSQSLGRYFDREYLCAPINLFGVSAPSQIEPVAAFVDGGSLHTH